jgi:diaminohydroxyphosphoribosylaminopyrimidine deaminase/5-amino-6-(5-phosphoribosylamino)uracil reductase
MLRALELAKMGRGSVSPNPMVGCVIARDGVIIGEGWHKKFGEPHAEVNAIASIKDKKLLGASVVYVNLEPCSHHGKTPPCVDLLLEHQVKKVVVSNLDINPLVGGNGIRKLKDNQVEVVTGVLQKAGNELNKRFFTFMAKNRPFVLLKWAETADGFIAHENYESKWITHEHSRQLVHRWRSEEDAVLVGTRTARHDDPRLNVRDWVGRNPVRVVIDRFLRLSDQLHLFDRSQPTLCYNLSRHEEHKNLAMVRLGEENFLGEMLQDMYQRGIQSVMVEGGAETLKNFIDKGLWDEARVFRAPRVFN